MEELREIWKDLFQSDAPPYSKKSLIKRVAYRLQEIACGSMSGEGEKKLTSLRNQLEQGKKVWSGNALPVGTVLTKEYKGEIHKVTVRGKRSFTYKDQLYTSLSAIATEIAGTRWNGLVFFGVK
ncbi:DUF2924 domain-containing protein [Wolbachia endosymbiont (group A) of Pogonocherus hispidulus]|uniref:DUF2924 domain-containing protein n=1 Tax=Wolbachia endosymbiont (group A) of Pogonocherus hispidulus TaxID=3066136 RepID=UPI00333F3408